MLLLYSGRSTSGERLKGGEMYGFDPYLIQFGRQATDVMLTTSVLDP